MSKNESPPVAKTTLTPVGHHLVIEPISLPEKSTGGIIIQHAGTNWDKLAKASRQLGTVLAIGPQCWKAHASGLAHYVDSRDPALEAWCKVGDLIFYSRHAGKFMFDPIVRKENPLEGQSDLKELYVINDDDVIAVLPPMAEWTVDALDVMTY
jgi:co-chaperonin GroES (HSP10)